MNLINRFMKKSFQPLKRQLCQLITTIDPLMLQLCQLLTTNVPSLTYRSITSHNSHFNIDSDHIKEGNE